MGKQFKEEKSETLDAKSRLEAFANVDNEDLDEGTSTYHKFTQPGEVVNGEFVKIDMREFKEGDGERECVVLKAVDGSKMLFAQTLIVQEIKKHWDLRKEVGFLVRIVYVGFAKPGTPDQYQNFRLLFEPVKAAQ